MELGWTPPFWSNSKKGTPQKLFSNVNVEFGVNYPSMTLVIKKIMFLFPVLFPPQRIFFHLNASSLRGALVSTMDAPSESDHMDLTAQIDSPLSLLLIPNWLQPNRLNRCLISALMSWLVASCAWPACPEAWLALMAWLATWTPASMADW